MSEPKKLKTVSFSQFSTWYACPYKWMNDYPLKKKVYETNLILAFGTSIHETVQLYLKTLFNKTEKQADSMDLNKYFKWSFKKEIKAKTIPHTPEDLNEFINDGQLMLAEFKDPVNRRRYFPRDKFELLGIETEINETIINNLNVVGFLDIVLREKQSGNIKIVDFKTSTRGWVTEKEDFTKLAQLRLYKALYAKKYSLPLNKIEVEFFIIKRKLYENSKYVQTRLNSFKPTAYKSDIEETLVEFTKFVKDCFTSAGEYIADKVYPKIPGPKKKNCKYCQYAKDKSCDQLATKQIFL